jgi:hypothetical protein
LSGKKLGKAKGKWYHHFAVCERKIYMTPTPIKKLASKLLTTEVCERVMSQTSLQHELKCLLDAENIHGLHDFWDACINHVGRGKRVLLFEFGVWEGKSIRYFSQGFNNPDSRFIGCDSFEGLPERWGTLGEKTFSTNGKMPQIDDARVHFVKGWFQNTLESALDKGRQLLPNPDEILIHFDADLYSSTLFLLSQLHDEFDHYYFIFDEFVGHESRALLNFQQDYGADLEFYCHTGGEIPGQVFGRVQNKKGKFEPGAAQMVSRPLINKPAPRAKL